MDHVEAVKYSQGKSTGPCRLWYYAGCQNMTNKNHKKLYKLQIEK